MAVTQNTYTGNGSTVLYSFTFPYLETTDIKVSLNGTNTTAYTLANATTIQFNTAPANGVNIKIYRVTDDAALAAQFYPGSAIRSADLNDNFTQNLYVTQESNRDATSAITTANSAISQALLANATATSAFNNAYAAVNTANTALSTANTASATATTAATNAATAVSTANTANSNAAAALNAVANSVQYQLVANVAAIPGSPADGDAVEVANSTGIESFSPLANRPAGFVGDTGLSVRMQYTSSGSTWNWLNYFAIDSDTRYLKKSGGTLTGALTLNADPTQNLQAATKQYVDNVANTANTANTTATTANTTANAALPKAGGAMTGDLTLNAQSDLRFADADSSNWVAFQGPATVSSNVTWTLPSADGTANQVLSTNGSGTLSWTTPSTGNTDTIEEGNTSVEVIDTGSDGRFVVKTEGSERARVDSSGRLLVGTSSARANFQQTYGGSLFSAVHQIEGAADTTTRVTSQVYGENSATGPAFVFAKHRSNSVGGQAVIQSNDVLGEISFQGSDGTKFIEGVNIKAAHSYEGGYIGTDYLDGSLTISIRDGVNVTPRIQINHRGNLDIFNTYTTLSSATTYAGGTKVIGYYNADGFNGGTSGSEILGFWLQQDGSWYNRTGVYASFSDIKLKENIVDAGSQWDDLKALRVRKYNLKEGETHTHIGLIAQEAELVSPGLVTDMRDRDKDGNELGTVTKGVKYSVLYMKAIKALQEAMERIETLEAKVAALEAQ